MRRALLLFGHADRDSFNHRLAESYGAAFTAAGGALERIDLASLSFDPVLRAGYRTPQPLEPDLARARDAITRADHLVWVFPTYWASPPAVVRAFIDRVFLPGWAFRFEGHALPTGLLRGRSARVVATMDSPGWWYTLRLRHPLHSAFASATLSFCGVAPVAVTTVHGVRAMSAAARERMHARVARLGGRDARAAAPPRPLLAPGGRAV